MEKGMVARLSALPLRHRVAAGVLYIAVSLAGVGLGWVLPQVSARGWGFRTVTVKNSSPADQTFSLRTTFQDRVASSAGVPQPEGREEGLLRVTIAALDQKAAALAKERVRSGGHGKAGARSAEAESVLAQLRGIRRQRALVWSRLKEASKDEPHFQTVALETSKGLKTHTLPQSTPATHFDREPAGFGGFAWAMLGALVGLLCGVVYLGVAFRRFKPIDRGELVALGVRRAIPVIGSIARIRP